MEVGPGLPRLPGFRGEVMWLRRVGGAAELSLGLWKVSPFTETGRTTTKRGTGGQRAEGGSQRGEGGGRGSLFWAPQKGRKSTGSIAASTNQQPGMGLEFLTSPRGGKGRGSASFHQAGGDKDPAGWGGTGGAQGGSASAPAIYVWVLWSKSLCHINLPESGQEGATPAFLPQSLPGDLVNFFPIVYRIGCFVLSDTSCPATSKLA